MDRQRSLITDAARRLGMNHRSTPGRVAGATALGDNEDRTTSSLTSAESI